MPTEPHPIPLEVTRVAPSVTLATVSGPVEIRQSARSLNCSGCGRRGGGMAEIHVDRGGGEKACIPLCGNCICSSVGIHIRRRHGLQPEAGR